MVKQAPHEPIIIIMIIMKLVFFPKYLELSIVPPITVLRKFYVDTLSTDRVRRGRISVIGKYFVDYKITSQKQSEHVNNLLSPDRSKTNWFLSTPSTKIE